VSFDRFGLAIVDEQHRFGVRQRLQLRAKSANPHALYMSATPIPRTLAQTKYAELDVSIIDELPPGRTPIRTFLLRRSRIARVYEFVRLAVARGGQAYVVAPAIESGESGMTSAVDEAERLRTTVFPDLRVDVLHGKMLPREKDAAMEAFARGETQVLVATTVVEVGVDVPNASVMVILDAHRFGLATLHQLRGRVGRGASESFCLLVAPDAAAEAERLTILERTTDGFEIAQADLEIRRSGELLGTAQAGGDEGTIGDLIDDFELYVEAKAAAQALLARDPALQDPEHAGLVRALARLGERAALVSA
jgi:ATP-dependent DNA helicase RecG